MNDHTSHLLASLNDAQREAVSAPLSNLLVLAGAGSGKTRVLVHRIAWLIEVEKLSPFNIMAVTFTNKAAREMQSRIEDMLGLSAKNLWIGTFHSLAHRLLRAHWKAAGLRQHFQIIDADDQLRLIKRTIRHLDLDEARWTPKQAQYYINQHKIKGLRADKVSADDHFNAAMLSIYHAYEAACVQSNLVDFAELLLRAFELWRDNADILDHYTQRFQAVLVDEFQDTNQLQYDWIKQLAGKQNHTLIVADDDQSIYSWRGANVDNIHLFEQEFPKTTKLHLEQNYRSTGNILRAANAVIANNDNRFEKTLWTDADDGERISIYAAFNDIDEARFIVDRIKQWEHAGNAFGDCAVLYRSNAQSRILEEVFVQSGTPYRIHGGRRFYDRAEIKDALGYLNLFGSRDNDTAVERVINTPARGIGHRTVELIRQIAVDEKCSLWSAIEKAVKEQLLPNRANTALASFIDQINTLDQQIEGQSLPQQVENTIRDSGLLAHFQKGKGEKARARVENLAELANAAQQFIAQDLDEKLSPLAAFLAHTALEASEAQSDKAASCAQLMTLHAAKGLEFPLIFIAGLEEDLFPHKMSLDSPHGLSEERRLCYVGMTRAMKKLYLCHAESRTLHGYERQQSPSRFLQELPEDCAEEVRLRNYVSLPLTHSTRTRAISQTTSENGLQIGQVVQHTKFGEGVILNLDGCGEKARVQVHFENAGSKWLIAALAKLTPAL
jgi:DNA helicase II / ATP-dependent DNA helicase PcrA